MSNFSFTPLDLREIESILSSDRLETYLSLAHGNHHKALEIYKANILKSHRFYTILHILEICLRNKIDERLRAKYGEQWFYKPDFGLTFEQIKSISENKYYDKTGQLIASLSFGFWTAFFGKSFEQLWRQELRFIFKTSTPLKRGYIAANLKNIRILRNRIAHHECILKMNLDNLEKSAYELINWLSPTALEWLISCLLQ